MNRLVTRASRKLGLKPGSVVYVGKERSDDVHLDVIDYTDTNYDEKHLANAEDSFPYRDSETLSWINVDGIHDTAQIEKLGAHFGLHPLVLEDIVNTHQRPKMEDYGEYIYIVARMLSLQEGSTELVSEQISLVRGLLLFMHMARFV